jgi:hypothetical protein
MSDHELDYQVETTDDQGNVFTYIFKLTVEGDGMTQTMVEQVDGSVMDQENFSASRQH